MRDFLGNEVNVGDKIYSIAWGRVEELWIYSIRENFISDGQTRYMASNPNNNAPPQCNDSICSFTDSSIGVKYFITEEDAINKLLDIGG